MSLKTWKKQYMPDAHNHVGRGIEAVEHSLKKWRGLLPANLKRHGMQHPVEWEDYNSVIREIKHPITEDLIIDADNCALCFHHPYGCGSCSLKVTLGAACDRPGQPYDLWVTSGRVHPMIKALERTLKRLKEREP